MSIRERISEDLKTAMKARDADRTSALRMIRAELLKAEKQTGQAPDEEGERATLQRMLKQRQEAAEQYDANDRAEAATRERAEADVIREYLPEELSEVEIKLILSDSLKLTGKVDLKELGRIMGQAMPRLKATGKLFEGRRVQAILKALLEEASARQQQAAAEATDDKGNETPAD